MMPKIPWNQIAMWLVSLIREETRSGVDAGGVRFAPYPKGYLNSKMGIIGKKMSRKRKTYKILGMNWLQVTGSMLNSIQSVGTMNGIEIGFVGQHPSGAMNSEIAMKNDQGIGVTRRHFWGLSNRRKLMLDRFIIQWLDNALRK